MKRIITLITLALFSASASVALAQDTQPTCTPEYIQQRVQSILDTFQQELGFAQGAETALQNVEDMQTALANLIELCNQPTKGAAAEDSSPGQGTMDDPYRYGVAGDTGEGFTVQITGFVRPADREIQRANMFNDRPGQGEAYILLNVKVTCLEGASRCDTNYFDFELTGDEGIIYDHPFVVMDNVLEASLFPGGEAEGRLVFLIRSNDSNLRLLHRANMFSGSIVVFEAEPGAGSGLQVTANNTANIRSGPGTDFPVTGSLSAAQTAIATGRNAEGTWLRLANGWVFGELVTPNGDVQSLPVVTE